ncbi:MAG TPA: HEAT repeat domain-containing protein [Candidatus Binatia bacterium]|jgi:HEAT repeat protein
MADILDQLISLIETAGVEQRCAGLLVAGALKIENPRLTKTVAAALDEANPIIRDYALRYLEGVQSKNAVSVIAKYLDDPDKDVQERTVRLLTGAGPPVVPLIADRAGAASRVWQLNGARVLAAVRGRKAAKALLQLLLSGTDEFNKSVCDLMMPLIRDLDDKGQEQLYDEVESFASDLDVKQQRPAVVSALRLFGQLGRPQARRWLFKFVAPEFPPVVRSHALVGLLRCLREQDLRKDEYTKLFPILEEAEFSEASRLAVELLEAHDLPEDSRAVLSRLMQSPHADVQKFALRKMGSVGTPATVRTLIEQLGDPDYRRRDVAASSLRKIPEARAALIKELIACEDASKAWSIAEILPSFEGKWRQDVLTALWERLESAMDSGDRIQKAFLHVLKQADANFAYEQIAAQGGRLVKTKKYREALPFLLALKDEFPECKPENKYQLGIAQLKVHSHTVITNRNHSAVELFSDLYRSSAYPLFESLKKEKSLAPEEVFALGFSLAERAGNERHLGRELLEHIATKFPRNKIGRSAKNKLRLAG